MEDAGRRGKAIQVTSDGGLAPIESPDGKSLYYTKHPEDACLWRVPLAGGPSTKVRDVSHYDFLDLAIVDKGIYFVPNSSASDFSIYVLDLQTNQTRQIASIERPFGGGLDNSPGGQWILYTQIDQLGTELRLVENFH